MDAYATINDRWEISWKTSYLHGNVDVEFGNLQEQNTV